MYNDSRSLFSADSFKWAILSLLLLVITIVIAQPLQPHSTTVLSEVLTHYSNPSDSLKQAATQFLFDNMEGHSYMTFDLADTNGAVVDFNVLSFANYDNLVASFDTLEKQHGVLDFKKRDVVDDDSVITAAFLINHIDLAFTAWQNRAWAKDFTFNQFCEYILPYRGSNEPLEKWREYFCTRYDSAFHHMKNPTDPIEAASLINQDLITWFHFDPRFYYHPTDQGLTDMLTTKLGRCEDMTNLTIYAMRANGLAVTSDYTPYWANSGNNHAWNSIVTTDGKVIPFMGAEANPGSYQLANKLAKVYRKTYSIQRSNLAFQVTDPDKLPKYISSKSYTDVTRDYTTVKDITFKLAAPDSVQFAYLCVFNSGEWKAIHWSKIADGSATFTDMGTDIAYLPAYYIDEKIVPAGLPFILTSGGEINTLAADTNRRVSVTLSSTTKTTLEISTDGIRKAAFTQGVSYELHYWEGGWKTACTQIAGETPITFTGVPSGCIYWLTAAESDREERIFTYDSDQQIWW